jgi:hypothetical protein
LALKFFFKGWALALATTGKVVVTVDVPLH